MSDNNQNYRFFHPLIENAYTAVHQWLETKGEYTNGYKSIDPRGKWQKILQGEELKSVAFQYYYLFPTHYFKSAHILENVVGEDRLISWLKHKQIICVLDIGCGAGAGTAALIEVWSNYFIKANSTWHQNRNELRKDLVALFRDSWQELQKLDNNNAGESRKLERYIRFALTRLSVLGLEDIIIALLDILYQAFWIIRDPSNVLENLARQGYVSEIRNLLTHYQNLNQPVEYLKAITIRAMRFLPNINAQDWELIVEFSTSSDNSVSVAEKLMATETWLCLGHKYNDFKQNRHIEAVKNALHSKPSPPSRLEKNYLLILGQFEPSAVQEFSVNPNDPMLVGARDLALQGSPSEIFDLPEPKILRENYYSAQSRTDSEQGSP